VRVSRADLNPSHRTGPLGLRAESLTVARGQRKVLQAVSCAVQPGRMLALLGANGAGKSTLLAAMAGELPWQSGQVWLDDARVQTQCVQAQAQRRAVLPQQSHLGFALDVQTVVRMGLYPFPHLPQAQVDAEIQRALRAVSLSHAAHQLYPTLSGGEQQRVQFARVWAQTRAAVKHHGHAYLLLDEPAANLDPRHQQQLLSMARTLADTARVGVLIVLHDLNLASRWCDELLLLKGGETLACGTPAQVLAPEHLEAAYGLRPVVMPHPLDARRLLVLF